MSTKCHGSGLTTPRSAGLGMAEPPPWPFRVVRPPPRAKTSSIFIFIYLFIFLKNLWPLGVAEPPRMGDGGGLATPKGQNPFSQFFFLWPWVAEPLSWGWFDHPKPVKGVVPLYISFLFFFQFFFCF
jgi:hypothetical protein